jgi:hypothetical protein
MTDINYPAPPGGGDRLPLDELNGSLLLFTVDKVVADITTAHGVTDAVACSVAALDGTHKGEVFDDTLIFPKVLRGQLKQYVGGGRVAARLGQGEKKPGKNAPWILVPASDDDKATVQKYAAHIAKQAEDLEAPF